MRSAILLFVTRLVHLFDYGSCFKESQGYRCRHQMHGDVLECGEWSKVRRAE